MSRVHRDAYAQIGDVQQVSANGASTLTVPAGATGIKMSNIVEFDTTGGFWSTNGAGYSLSGAITNFNSAIPIAQVGAGMGFAETVVWFGEGQNAVYVYLSNPAIVNYAWIRPIRTN